MHLASGDLLTRPSASTAAGVQSGEIREEVEQSEEPGSKPSTSPHRYTHLHNKCFAPLWICSGFLLFFSRSAANKNSKDVPSPVCCAQEQCRRQRDVSLCQSSPPSPRQLLNNFGAECPRLSELDAAPSIQKGLPLPRGGGGDDTLSADSSSGAQGDEKSKTYGIRGGWLITGCWERHQLPGRDSE